MVCGVARKFTHTSTPVPVHEGVYNPSSGRLCWSMRSVPQVYLDDFTTPSSGAPIKSGQRFFSFAHYNLFKALFVSWWQSLITCDAADRLKLQQVVERF